MNAIICYLIFKLNVLFANIFISYFIVSLRIIYKINFGYNTLMLHLYK